jgi:hypothetical protein
MTDHFRVPILNDEWGVWIAWGSEPVLNAFLRRRGLSEALEEDNWDRRRAACVWAVRREPVICLPGPPSLEPEVLGAIAHEATHAVNHILRSIEVEAVDEEILAHCTGAIVRSAAKWAVKHGKASRNLAERESVGPLNASPLAKSSTKRKCE